MVATGHYSRVEDGSLYRGVDTSKDQSYFLYRLTSEELQHVIFPVGGMQKTEVRELARKFALPNAKRKDSQGLCFVGDISLPEFLSRYITLENGALKNAEGNIVGEHYGSALYTTGQRHGFNTESSVPLYVTSIDAQTNTVNVSARKSDALKKEVSIANMHWISGKPQLPKTFDAQARYREKPCKVSVSEVGGAYVASFVEPHLASPGQSLVLYEGGECIGGGVIALQSKHTVNRFTDRTRAIQ